MSEGAVMTRGGRRCSLLLAVLGVFAGLASGCMVGPDYHPPQVTAPASWAGVATAPATQPSVATAEPAELTHWWDAVQGPDLDDLSRGGGDGEPRPSTRRGPPPPGPCRPGGRRRGALAGRRRVRCVPARAYGRAHPG